MTTHRVQPPLIATPRSVQPLLIATTHRLQPLLITSHSVQPPVIAFSTNPTLINPSQRAIPDNIHHSERAMTAHHDSERTMTAHDHSHLPTTPHHDSQRAITAHNYSQHFITAHSVISSQVIGRVTPCTTRSTVSITFQLIPCVWPGLLVRLRAVSEPAKARVTSVHHQVSE